jgi:hypothetical protein
MNIISAKYISNPDNPNENVRVRCILDNGKYHSVVIDPNRTSYQEIMRQVEAGELTIEPADEE